MDEIQFLKNKKNEINSQKIKNIERHKSKNLNIFKIIVLYIIFLVILIIIILSFILFEKKKYLKEEKKEEKVFKNKMTKLKQYYQIDAFTIESLVHLPGETLIEKLNKLKIDHSIYKVKNHPSESKNIQIPSPCQDGIDVVITWVNGSDPNFIEKLNKYKQTEQGDNGLNRFRETNILKYNIRSVYEYAPYIKNYYLVTDNQAPSFLNLSHLTYQDYKFRIVDHKEIFLNQSDLPVFNANAIEVNLHHIKGLKKCFLFLNDDFLLSNYIYPDYFISNSQIKVRTEQYGVPAKEPFDDLLWEKLMENTNIKVNTILGLPINTTHYFSCHNGYFFDKDIFYELEEQLKNDFIDISKRKFRVKDDIQIPFAFAIYNLEKYNAPIQSCANEEQFYYELSTVVKENDKMMQQVLNSKSKSICINDKVDSGNIEEQLIKLNIALEIKYPYPSPFENGAQFE